MAWSNRYGGMSYCNSARVRTPGLPTRPIEKHCHSIVFVPDGACSIRQYLEHRWQLDVGFVALRAWLSVQSIPAQVCWVIMSGGSSFSLEDVRIGFMCIPTVESVFTFREWRETI